jgi:hypothetical protein
MQFRSNPFLYTILVVIPILEKNLTLECNLIFNFLWFNNLQ